MLHSNYSNYSVLPYGKYRGRPTPLPPTQGKTVKSRQLPTQDRRRDRFNIENVDFHEILQKPIQTDGIDEVIFLGRHKKGADTGEKWDRISSNLKSWMYPYITLLGMRMKVETLSTVKINDLGDEPIMKFINNEAA